jgi:hypothetical protein
MLDLAAMDDGDESLPDEGKREDYRGSPCFMGTPKRTDSIQAQLSTNLHE